MAKWITIIFIGVMMATLVNAQLLSTLNGVKLQTQDDYLEIGISQPFRMGIDIQGIVIGSEKRNETYYPYFLTKVINPNFWVEEVNVTEQVNCTGGGEDLDFQCTEFTYKINRSRRIKFTLTFGRDITEEYIEGWDWHNINLGKNFRLDADFKCYFNNSLSDKNIVDYTLIDRINTKQNQTDITITFNFSGVEAGSIVRCEDPIYNVKKFYDEFDDLSQWNNDGLENWFAESGSACSGVGCTGGGACATSVGTSSNMSISYNIDVSDCVNGTAMVNWTASEIGTSDPEDCLNTSYSLDGGTTWILRNTTFCDDLTAATAYGFKVPNESYSSQFRWGFRCHNFQAAGEAINIQMFNITCNSTKAVVSNCGNLNTGNVQYDLRKNVNFTGGNCFNVVADNVTVDCHGYSIIPPTAGAGFQGIVINQYNKSIIRSCNILNASINNAGIRIIGTNHTLIYNITIANDNTGGLGIVLQTNPYNISIYDYKYVGNRSSSAGFSALTGFSNSLFYNLNISIANFTGIRIERGNSSLFYNINIYNITTITNSKDNLFYNFNLSYLFLNNSLNINFTNGSLNYDILITSNSTNNLFINNSFNKSRVVFAPRSPDNPVEINNITVKWYLSINISNSTKTIGGAEANVNDSFNNNIKNNMGSDLLTIEVTEYTQNGSVAWGQFDSCIDIAEKTNITCFSPYNISANMTGYTSNATSIEMNRSKLVNLFLGIIEGVGSPVSQVAKCMTINNFGRCFINFCEKKMKIC